ncbi:MAG: hypothetical protein M0Z62_02210 [Actinomycetota bacterium]|nr:hypothetical protein [Actinomycetota bacterium]
MDGAALTGEGADAASPPPPPGARRGDPVDPAACASTIAVSGSMAER